MRYYTKQYAIKLGVFGWVANKPDGSVEIVAEGEEEALMKLLSFCKTGTKWAKIARVTEAWEDATESYEEFRIIY